MLNLSKNKSDNLEIYNNVTIQVCHTHKEIIRRLSQHKYHSVMFDSSKDKSLILSFRTYQGESALYPQISTYTRTYKEDSAHKSFPSI